MKNMNIFIYSCYLFIFYLLFHVCNAQSPEKLLMKGMSFNRLSEIYDTKSFSLSDKSTVKETLYDDLPIDCRNCIEIIEKRTLTSRTFQSDDGKIIIEYGAENLNYTNKNGDLKPVNPKLSHSANGWAATEQEFPTYLNKDGSTALTVDNENRMVFNKNNTINGTILNNSNYTVGKNGMYIYSVIPNVDKRIVFQENRIKTDYVINAPLNIPSNLIITDEVVLPKGYVIKMEKENTLSTSSYDVVIYSPQGIEKARFKAPVFYDAHAALLVGSYNVVSKENNYVIETIVPTAWLNANERKYPVTIDPLVIGPKSAYPFQYLPTCRFPNFKGDSMLITIPANITITNFIVTDSYYSDMLKGMLKKNGFVYFTTPCAKSPILSVDNEIKEAIIPGYAYLDSADLKLWLACCFPPSCTERAFYLAHFFSRDTAGTSCNQDYVYYTPWSPWPFRAFIVGRTVEATWTVSPTTICGDSCTIFLTAPTYYGVPPYTITHPWFAGSKEYGLWASCTSGGTETIPLTVPNCPTICGSTSFNTVDIPPPVIVDVCNNKVEGLSNQSLTIKPVPDVKASSLKVCSEDSVNMNVSSCIPSSTINWTGNDGTKGLGNVSYKSNNTSNISNEINYTFTPEADGCSGQTINAIVVINPLPIIQTSNDTTIMESTTANLTVTEDSSYVYIWKPSESLSEPNTSNPLASPINTTTYSVIVTDDNGCESSDEVKVTVLTKEGELWIPNAFTPNGDYKNDLFYIYGTEIDTIELSIFNRWGEMIFQTTNRYEGWDGKYKNQFVPQGIYVYVLFCTWNNRKRTTRTGMIAVIY